MSILRGVGAVLVLIIGLAGSSSCGQDVARDPGREADVAADRREASAEVWADLVAHAQDDATGARVVRALGRVGAPTLVPVLRAVLANEARDLSGEMGAATALAVGLMGDPGLLLPLSTRVAAADVALALGRVGSLPADAAAREAILRALRASRDSRSVAARLLHGTRVQEPVFQAEALEVLGSKDAPAACRRAAAFYLSRHADPPPMTALGPLASVLEDRDPDTAAFGARAWARIVGAGAMEAAVLALAFEEGGPRMVQIARLRALASLPPGPSRTVFTAALGDDDPHIRLTALESLAACGGRLASDDRAGLATFAVLMEETDPVMGVRRAAVLALARIAPEIFLPRLPRYRLGAPPMVRIAAAEAIGGMPWQDVVLTAAQRFLCDPDRRVAQALLEAAERRVKEGEAAEVDRIVSGLLRLDGEGEAPVAAGRGDPVLLGLLAKVGTALLARPDLTPPSRPRDLFPLLERLVASTPPTEVESLQAIIDLAAALPPSTGTPVLRVLARTAEPALHDQAARHLRGRGEAVPAPLPLARPWTPSPDPATRAIVHTARGEIALDLRPDVAPATVANFVQLARQGFYDGVLFHRVVPGFVAQAGCPRGDGWGGPGYTIRCENSALTYQRGTLGMALAGKDTGGSQWFICHEAQPHLDLRYPIFGQVAAGLDVLDALLPGDVILTVTIP